MAKKEERFEVTFRDGSQLKDEGDVYKRQVFGDVGVTIIAVLNAMRILKK